MKRTIRLRTWVLGALALFAGVAQADAGRLDQEASFEIPAQPLSTALVQFSKQAALQVVTASVELGEQETAGVLGKKTLREALETLLSRSGLQYSLVGANTVAIGIAGKKPQARRLQGAGGMRLAGLTTNEISSSGQSTEQEDRKAADAAKNADRQIDEIIVTAQKREQRLLDVPMSVTALTSDALARDGVKSMADLSYVVPDLSLSEFGQYQVPAIRGVGNSNGSSSLVGVYIDEAAVTGGPFTQLDLRVLDLERVEILRGPQGTLYGEGSTSGTIRFITKDPQLDRAGGTADFSFYNTEKGGWSEEVAGVVNIPIVQDVFGLRIAGTYENRSGWIDQPATGREDINDSELMNVRMKALWRPSEALAVKGMAIVHRNEGDGYNFVNGPSREDSEFVPRVNPTAPTPFSDDYEIYNLTVSYDLGRATLLSSSSYVESDRSFVDATRSYHFLPVTAAPIEYLISGQLGLRTFTQELRLTASSERLSWSAGAFYRDYKDTSIQRNDFARGGTSLGTIPSDTDRLSESWAVFGDAGYKLTDRMELGAGLRYFKDDRRQVNNLSAFRQEGSFHSFSPRVYFSYALTRDANVYASAAKGFRSGGFNTGTLGGAPLPPYEPESLWSYELGSKASVLDGRFSMELALFYSEYQDMQAYGVPVSGSFSGGFVSNIGQAEIKGIDGEFTWKVTDRLTLGFGGNVLDSEVVALDATSTSRQLNPGDPLDSIPDYSYFVTADYAFHWSAGVPGFVRANYNVQGESTSVIRNIGLVDPIGHSDRLDFLNARIGAVWNRWTVEVFAQNLLDETGTVTAYEWASIAAQARPRTLGVQLHYDFD